MTFLEKLNQIFENYPSIEDYHSLKFGFNPEKTRFWLKTDRGDIIASVDLNPQDKSDVVSVKVDQYKRGKGIANAMYDRIEKETGVTIKPSDSMTPEGFKMWQRRNPDAVKNKLYNFKDQLIGKNVTVNGSDDWIITNVRSDSAEARKGGKGGIAIALKTSELIDQGLLPQL